MFNSFSLSPSTFCTENSKSFGRVTNFTTIKSLILTLKRGEGSAPKADVLAFQSKLMLGVWQGIKPNILRYHGITNVQNLVKSATDALSSVSGTM